MGRASQMAGAANAMGMTNSIGEMEAAKDKMAQRSKLVEAMTTIERKTPALFVGTDADAQERKQRVADSCGVDAEEVQKFINEFVLMRSAAMKFSSGMDQEQIKFEMAKEQRDMGDPISRRARRMLDRKDKSQGKKKKSGRKGSVGRGFS
jgi:signal recognition particle GTPase